MPYELEISLRYLQSKRKQMFISLITWISIGGVTVGVMTLIIVLAVMSGFEKDLRGKILGTNSHVVVLEHGNKGMARYQEVQKQVEQVPHVVAVTPFIYSQVMLTSESNVSGVVIRGIDPQQEGKVTDLVRNLRAGSLDRLEGEKPGILLGKELAKVLQAFIGQEITVVSPLGRSTPVGMVPHMKKFRVAGIFDTGMFEYDYNLAYIALSEAQKFFRLGDRVTGLEVKIDDIYRAREVARAIEARLGYPYWTRDWMEMNRNLFSALKLEKITMFIILVLIVLVAAFNIVSTLIMMVMEKNRDIAILKSMGATRQSIMKIFMAEGLIIGVTGTLLGIGGGYLVCRLLEKYQFIKLPSDVYYLDRLPVNMQGLDFLLVSLAAILISFLATLYPAWNASRLNPVEVLRYE
ncbi:MAG: lipoprotein-releasing ABC transporter permease subunit [Nitrospinota bacterium]|nr:MAG: lipoprotein-releasing ABC transporter permease subunit [Nitrospinota bacterium]